MKRALILVLSIFTINGFVISQGAGNTIDLGSNASGNNHINVGNLSAINTSDFTVEMWIYTDGMIVGDTYEDPPIFSNKDWASGSNTGLCIFIKNNTTFNLQCNFKAPTGARVDHNTNVSLLNGWHHIAATFDRTDSMKFYIDGVFAGGKSIAGTTGSIATSNSYKIGQDGIGIYTNKFRGKVDEFRVWSEVRNVNQIRDNMCHLLSGSESNLVCYLKMDEGTGTLINDLSPNNNDGTLANGNSGSWIKSGAPLGNVSNHLYTANLTGQNFSLTSVGNGNVSVSNVTGTPNGIHIYRVDALPNTTTGILGLGGNNVYYGTFVAGGTTPVYSLTYDYSNYPAAVLNENNLYLFGRNDNTGLTWSNQSAVLNTTSDNLTLNLNTRKEIILGGIVPIVCNDPSSIVASNIQSSSADISWTTGGSGNSNIQYGNQGFSLGTGTSILNINSNPYSITGLNSNTAYDVYIQDTCLGFGSSNWIGPMTFTTLSNPGLTGAGTSLNFGLNKYISVGTSAILKPTTQITVESWVYPRSTSDWMAFISNAQDNSSNESGYSMSYYNGKWRFFLMTENMSGNEWNNNPGIDLPLNQWSHVCGTYDGSTIKFYLNGILIESKNATGNIDWQYNPIDFRIGMFVDDNESYYFDGEVDEVRIWNVARTQTEIRNEMCRKLSGSESGLLGYWRLDDASGTIATDLTSQSLDGSLTNMLPGDWKISGAAIGDQSTHNYTTAWNGITVILNSTDNGNLEVNTITGIPNGIQVYRVDNPPYSTNGVYDPGNSDTYYGVFIIDGNNPTYNVKYTYSNFPNAVSNENYLHLYNRNDGSVYTWQNSGANLNTSNNELTLSNINARKEFYLADFTFNPCQSSSGLGAINISYNNATLVWNGGSGNSYNIEWGPLGFNLGSGNNVNNITADSLQLTGLSHSTSYQFYIEDSCTTGNSSWVGPYTFTTLEICPSISNIQVNNITANSAVLTWTGGTPNWEIEWGITGFNQGSGILSNVTTNPHSLNFLSPSTTYDVYFRDDCDSLSSNWSGPFTFTTQPIGFGLENELQLDFQIYPNPTDEWIHINSGQLNDDVIISITDIKGKLISETKIHFSENFSVNIKLLPAGIYVLKIHHEDFQYISRIIKK